MGVSPYPSEMLPSLDACSVRRPVEYGMTRQRVAATEDRVAASINDDTCDEDERHHRPNDAGADTEW
jgi:hypothetical protein